jgi:hypothetical protein
MNHYYLYWDVDGVNWDTIYDVYKPKFDELGVIKLSDKNSLNNAVKYAVGYYKEMVAGLSDSHLVLKFSDDTTYSPASERVILRQDFLMFDRIFGDGLWYAPGDVEYGIADNWFENVILKRNDFDNENHFPKAATSRADADGGFKAATGHITINSGPGYILYFYFNKFALADHLNHPGYGPVINQFLNDLPDPNVKGVIFDLRGNTGGAADDIGMILGPLLTRPLKIANTRTKNGPGRLDYAPWGSFYIYPAPEDKRVKNPGIPVVALVNELSISCGELTPMAIRELPNGRLMGKRTFGATGPRMSDDNPAYANGGSFKGGYVVTQVNQAGWQTRSAGGENFEGIGVPVDETLTFNDSDGWPQFRGSASADANITETKDSQGRVVRINITHGTDAQDLWLEEAVNYIKDNQ